MFLEPSLDLNEPIQDNVESGSRVTPSENILIFLERMPCHKTNYTIFLSWVESIK